SLASRRLGRLRPNRPGPPALPRTLHAFVSWSGSDSRKSLSLTCMFRLVIVLPHQRSVARRAEAHVHLGLASRLLPGEPQPNRDVKRRPVETYLGRKRALPAPGPARRRRLLGEPAPRSPALLPCAAATYDPPLDAIGPRDQCHDTVLPTAFERDRFELP